MSHIKGAIERVIDNGARFGAVIEMLIGEMAQTEQTMKRLATQISRLRLQSGSSGFAC